MIRLTLRRRYCATTFVATPCFHLVAPRATKPDPIRIGFGASLFVTVRQ